MDAIWWLIIGNGCRRRSSGWFLGYYLKQLGELRKAFLSWKKIRWWIYFATLVSSVVNVKNFLKYCFIEIEFTFCTIHPCRVSNIVFFSIFAGLYNYHHNLIFRTFSSSLKETSVPISSQSPFLLSPTPQTTNLLFVSLGLFILGILYQWNRRMCSFLLLASFI